MGRKPKPRTEKLGSGVATASLNAIIVGPDGEIPVDAVVQYWAGEMRKLYDKYGDERFENAVYALVPRAANPPIKHDDRWLQLMKELIFKGRAETRHSAAVMVVQFHGDEIEGSSEPAKVKRLDGKYATHSDWPQKVSD